jgi:hypothetical protein
MLRTQRLKPKLLEYSIFVLIFLFSFDIPARVYFNMTRYSIDKVGREKERETFPVPHAGNGSKNYLFYS